MKYAYMTLASQIAAEISRYIQLTGQIGWEEKPTQKDQQYAIAGNLNENLRQAGQAAAFEQEPIVLN